MDPCTDLRAHVTNGDELGAVFQPLIVLLQDLYEGLALPWSETAHKLDQIGRVRIVDGPVYVDAHLVGPVDKLQVQHLGQLLLL